MTATAGTSQSDSNDLVSSRIIAPWPVIAMMINRSFVSLRRIPVAVIPVLVMPMFFTLAFSGTFEGLTKLPGYPTDNILNWMVPYACVQSAGLGALSVAFSLGRDLEGGFYDRLLMSPAPRWTLPTSGVLWSMLRSLLPLTVTLTIGLLGGMTFPGGPLTPVLLGIAGAGVAGIAALWALGVVYRLKVQSAGGLVQIGLFVAMFLSVGTVPIDLQQGWLPSVARLNPLTPILGLARAGFIGTIEWAEVWPGFVSMGVLGVLFAWFAYRGMRTLDP